MNRTRQRRPIRRGSRTWWRRAPPAFDTLPTAAPSWLKNEPPLAAVQQRNADFVFRERVQAVQAVDRMIAKVRATLTAAGVANDTYIVFSSDNGYHIGEYRLLPGKQTAFDTDVRVPLVVVGPGVPAGVTRNQIVQNTDLAPTFEELAGVPVAPTVDGHSLVAAATAGSGRGLAHRGIDRAPRPERRRRRPRRAAYAKRRSDHIRGDAYDRVHIRRVHRRGEGVLRPRDGPV